MTGRLGLLLCLAVAAALRFTLLGRADLWSDEVHTYGAVALPWGEMCAERLRAGHLPLWFLAEKAWVGVFGDGQFALRSLSALCGTLAVLPAWTFFRRMLAPQHATAATALVAVHPLLVELSREARMYSFALLLLFVMLDGAAAALASGRVPKRTWIASALGCATHPTFGFAVAAVVLWLAWERRIRAEVRTAAARAQLAVASGLAVLLVAIPFVEPQHQELTRRAWYAEAAMFLGRPLVGSDFVHVTYGKIVAGALLCVWLQRLLAGHVHRDGSPARRLGWTLALAVPAMSFAVGALGAVPWGPARYVQAASVGWVLLVAAFSAETQTAGASAGAAPRRHVETSTAGDVRHSARRSFRWLAGGSARGLATLAVACAVAAVLPWDRPRGWSSVAEWLRTGSGPGTVYSSVDNCMISDHHEFADRGAREAVAFTAGDALVLSHYLGRPVRVKPREDVETMHLVWNWTPVQESPEFSVVAGAIDDVPWTWAMLVPDPGADAADAASEAPR